MHKFFDALRKFFIGIEFKGKGGFVELYKWRVRWFDKIKSEVESWQVDEFYNLLQSFLSYPDELVSSYDVGLVWSSMDKYYVATVKVFDDAPIGDVYFDLSKFEVMSVNDKIDLVFEVKTKSPLTFYVYWAKPNHVFDFHAVVEQVKDVISEKDLLKVFKSFKRRGKNVDIFIHKDMRKYLFEKFKRWFGQCCFEGNFKDVDTEKLQLIANRLIELIATFEDKLVEIWNKPRQVKSFGYVISLDRLLSKNPALVEKIINHPNINRQIQEWKELNLVPEDFTQQDLLNWFYEQSQEKGY